MALRVLLGDESSTIKKVFQLALQDFAVEVRPVNIGLDVVSVATGFKPDIIFIDVLLQKKNGYDVSAELKQNAQLRNIPVVLMWSGFMELDEDKFQISMANGRLEKPFDVGALRKLVSDLVPRTKDQKVSQYLNFPKMPDLEESKNAEPEMADQDEDDFQQVPIPKMKGGDKFRLNLKPEELEESHVPVAYDLPSEKSIEASPSPAPAEVEEKDEFAIRDASDIELEDLVEDEGERFSAVNNPPPKPAQVSAGAPQLSPQQLENLIRAQSAEVIESVVWRVVPELAAQIIERELNKLLKERDLNP